MQQITVDSQVSKLLVDVKGQAVVCDSSGRARGVFSPIDGHPPFDELRLEPRLSIAETEELRKRARTGKPLQEILKRLGFE